MDFLKFLKKLVIAAGFFLAAIFYVRGEQSNTGDNTAILLENPAADGGAECGQYGRFGSRCGGFRETGGSCADSGFCGHGRKRTLRFS